MLGKLVIGGVLVATFVFACGRRAAPVSEPWMGQQLGQSSASSTGSNHALPPDAAGPTGVSVAWPRGAGSGAPVPVVDEPLPAPADAGAPGVFSPPPDA